MYEILILNGPNLGHLGERKPEIYGSEGMDALEELLPRYLGRAVAEVNTRYHQSNSEGELIDTLEEARRQGVHGCAFNAGAFTHTSLAIADCLQWIEIPTVEVHLSNVWARSEKLRHNSYMARHCIGVVAGFGMDSYALAVSALYHYLQNQPEA